jgi:hypothetical protein
MHVFSACLVQLEWWPFGGVRVNSIHWQLHLEGRQSAQGRGAASARVGRGSGCLKFVKDHGGGIWEEEIMDLQFVET